MDANELRGQLGKLISSFDVDGSDGDEPGGVADPFSAPNTWEERKRVEKQNQKQQPTKDEVRPRSGSRRAQQAAANAAKQPPKENDNPDELGKGATVTVGQDSQKSSLADETSEKAPTRTRLPACADWWTELVPYPSGAQPLGATELELLQARAEILYEAEVKAQAAYEARKHGADHRMMKKLLSAGTAKDKIAALTVQVQESSFHCLPFLRQLVGLVERPAKEVKLAAVEATSELFLTRLLPPRALLPLHKQPLGHQPSDAQVLQAYFEAELKTLYTTFADVVIAGANDTIVHFKQASCHIRPVGSYKKCRLGYAHSFTNAPCTNPLMRPSLRASLERCWRERVGWAVGRAVGRAEGCACGTPIHLVLAVRVVGGRCSSAGCLRC